MFSKTINSLLRDPDELSVLRNRYFGPVLFHLEIVWSLSKQIKFNTLKKGKELFRNDYKYQEK